MHFTLSLRSRLFVAALLIVGGLLYSAQPISRAQKLSGSADAEVIPTVQARRASAASRVAAKGEKAVQSQPAVRLAPAASFTNSTPITITDCPDPCPASGQAASLYPSPITVSGEVGVVQRVSVTLNGLSHTFPADMDFLLVSPSGRKSVIHSDFGGAVSGGAATISNINVTLDDYAQRPIPSTVTGNTGVPYVSGSYRPANTGTTDAFPAPAPAAPYTYTLSAFNGDNPNGTWNLFIIDDANGDVGSLSGGWTLTFDARPPAPAAGQIRISEFRTRGTGTTPPASDGSADEFIELYNATDSSITIIDAVPGADPTLAAGAGWRFAAAQGAIETTFLVLPQTLSTAGPLAIPARGYFLISTQPTTPSPAGNTYSIASYPSGTGITASGTANVSLNPASATTGFLPDAAGLAVFSTAAALPTNLLDAVGFSSVTNPLYKEGAGLAPATGITIISQHAWARKLTGGVPQDTGVNENDFVLVDPTGAILSGAQSTLGAPGPQRGVTATAFTTSSAPITRNDSIKATMIDLGCLGTATNPASPTACARERNTTPVTNGAQGVLKIRRKFTNMTGAPVYTLRFRVVDITTLGNGGGTGGVADLRVLNSTAQTVTNSSALPVSLIAVTLQTPPLQPNGGGLNSSLGTSSITTTAPLAAGASVNLEFTLGVQTTGTFRFFINIEALPFVQ